MSTPEKSKEIDRRSFLKWSLLSSSALAATVGGCGLLTVKERFNQAVQVLTAAAQVTTDASLGSYCRLTATGDFALLNPINPLDGQRVMWEIIQDAEGGRRITLDSKFALGADVNHITLSTTPLKRDFLTAAYNAVTDKWYVVGFVKGY